MRHYSVIFLFAPTRVIIWIVKGGVVFTFNRIFMVMN